MDYSSKIGFGSALLVLNLFVGGASNAAEPKATLASGSFSEELREQVPVSGSAIVGATIGNLSPGSVQTLAVQASPQSANVEAICVVAVTQDGRYRAENSYQLPARSGAQIIELPFPTAHADVLRQSSFVATARRGNCKSARDNVLLPIILGARATAASEVAIAVNGGGNMIFIRSGTESAPQTRCTRSDYGRPIAFDTLCVVKLEGDEGSTFPVWIEERRGPETISITSLQLATGR